MTGAGQNIFIEFQAPYDKNKSRRNIHFIRVKEWAPKQLLPQFWLSPKFKMDFYYFTYTDKEKNNRMFQDKFRLLQTEIMQIQYKLLVSQ